MIGSQGSRSDALPAATSARGRDRIRGMGGASDAPRGRFLILDGLDGCGKTTQALRLVRALGRGRPSAVQPLHLREPGSTAFGERLRALLLDRALAPRPAVEALCFAAARRQMLEELVAPALALGRDVVCERFHASTYAYQAFAGGLDEGALLELLATWAGEPLPDLELVLDLDAAEAAARRGADRDRIEDRGIAFQERVAEGFRRYVERAPRALRVDASGSADVVHARIVEAIEARLGAHGGAR